MYVCVNVANKKNKPALGDALELTSNNLSQDLSKKKTTEKQRLAILFLKSVTKKKDLNSHRDCLDTELNNNAPSF